MSILDQDGRVYVDQNEATAALYFSDGQNEDVNSAILNYESVANEGVFDFKDLNILTTPKT